ncbi:hypothetical protein AB0H34_03075 [Saccharopolyspora shandongensis]|uniref:hypothetical protein n=1 Tax=Saccharopolyspora shandongensis TaxID=418495 RepID=UPI00340795EC
MLKRLRGQGHLIRLRDGVFVYRATTSEAEQVAESSASVLGDDRAADDGGVVRELVRDTNLVSVTSGSVAVPGRTTAEGQARVS